VLGLCYVVVKVALLLVIEILAFPVICGWWLDICSLSLFDATLKVEDRLRAQRKFLPRCIARTMLGSIL
jgi:E3 ubiquitin-protein ligase DOA10